MSKILEIKDLSVSYGGIEAIKNISLDVEAGSIVTLIGSNGAGKSSTLRSIAGIVKAKSGEVLFEHYCLTRRYRSFRCSMRQSRSPHRFAPA